MDRIDVLALGCALIIAVLAPIRAASQSIPLRNFDSRPDEVAARRAELASQQKLRAEASQRRSEAYRQARDLYKNCARELRPFCMLSAQTTIREADFRYREAEARDFPSITVLEKALAAQPSAR